MLAATLLALAAAVLHASWNLAIKTSGDRAAFAWGQFVFGGVLFSPLLVWSGLPHGGAWPFLAASAVLHLGYVEALVLAYHHGDFSFAYPLARGAGAVTAAVLGVLALGDTLPVLAWCAIAVVAAGLVSLVRPSTSRASLGFALVTGAVIGSYTVIDTAGARHAGAAVAQRLAYGIVLTVLAGVVLTVAGLARGRGAEVRAALRAQWPRMAVSGAAVTAAYSLVLVAVSIRGVSVGYVATLRESSVVLGALAGWLFLHERLGRPRLLSSLVVLGGMIGLIVAR